jgi:putative FmdB family regulatory protein
MPIYEYLCHSCGKKFEVIQKFSDKPLLIHEVCGGPVEKLISTSALQFKGSGWYVNDYAKGAASKPGDTKVDGKAEGSSESKAESKSETKAETKTETKSESKPAVTESKPAVASSTPSSSASDSK